MDTKLENKLKSLTHSDILVFVALESEIDPKDWQSDCCVVFTGIGKVNAALTAQREIAIRAPKLVINLGTAGAIDEKYRGVCEIKSVMQRDFDTSPLAPRGEVPYQEFPSTFQSEFGKFSCGTGDSFMTEIDPWINANGVQLVDMELYSIARVCAGYEIPWRSVKYVTDIVGENSGDDWTNNLKVAQFELVAWFRKNIDSQLIES